MNSVYKTTLIASGGTISELATACSSCLHQLRDADPGIYVREAFCIGEGSGDRLHIKNMHMYNTNVKHVFHTRVFMCKDHTCIECLFVHA